MACKHTLPTGLYLVGDTYYLDVTDPVGKRHRKSLKTRSKTLALAIYNKQREQIIATGYGLGERDTSIDSFLSRYLNEAKLFKSPRVYREDKRRLELFFQFARVRRLEELLPEHFTRFFSWRLETGKTASGSTIKRSTAIHDVRIIRTALNWAVENALLVKNPAPRPRVWTEDMVRKRISYLEEGERNRLLTACAGEVPFRVSKKNPPSKDAPTPGRARKTPLLPIVACAVYAGLRLGEILHLDWEDLDFVRKEVRVSEKEAESWRPKTRMERVVPLFPPLEAILTPFRQGHGACFLTSTGARLAKRNVLRDLQRVAERAKIRVENGDDVNFVVTRHTFATHLVSAGVPIYAVSRWLGHTSITTTERHYAEFAPHDSVVLQAAQVFSASSTKAAS